MKVTKTCIIDKFNLSGWSDLLASNFNPSPMRLPLVKWDYK